MKKVYCEDCKYRIKNGIKSFLVPKEHFYICSIYDISRSSKEMEYKRGRDTRWRVDGWGTFDGNEKGQCKKYKRKWYKFWIKRL